MSKLLVLFRPRRSNKTYMHIERLPTEVLTHAQAVNYGRALVDQTLFVFLSARIIDASVSLETSK